MATFVVTYAYFVKKIYNKAENFDIYEVFNKCFNLRLSIYDIF